MEIDYGVIYIASKDMDNMDTMNVAGCVASEDMDT